MAVRQMVVSPVKQIAFCLSPSLNFYTLVHISSITHLRGTIQTGACRLLGDRPS